MLFRSVHIPRSSCGARIFFIVITAATALAQTEVFPRTETTAPTETVLHSFCSLANCADGDLPSAELIPDSKGNLYGTTYYGGTGNCTYGNLCGTVFKLSPNGKETVLHSFAFNGKDGYNPEARLLMDPKGNLYSTTLNGGTNSGGTVFELSPGAEGRWTEIILYSFGSNSTDGKSPYAGLIIDAKGNLYGTTGNGGTGLCSIGLTVGCGTVFELTPGANGVWKENILYNFANDGEDGNYPTAALIMDESGHLYGTTSQGGTYGYGTVFKLTHGTNGIWAETILHSFANGSDGNEPMAGLIVDSKENLYGTTYYGGTSSYGTVFELSAKGTETILHSFANNGDGSYSQAGLLMDEKGDLYGTTRYGGSGTCNEGESGYAGCGTVFELSPGPNGLWDEKIVYGFVNNGKDGVDPEAGLFLGANGYLYGTTSIGGTFGGGTTFKLMP
jgi:uncharacterized repeat protein (TIGR03803 family)